MTRNTLLRTFTLTTLLVLAADHSISSATAQSYCNLAPFVADSGANDIMIGRAVDGPAISPTLRDYIRVCWKDSGGNWNAESFPSCNAASPGRFLVKADPGAMLDSDYDVSVDADVGGNDRVSVLSSAQGRVFECVVEGDLNEPVLIATMQAPTFGGQSVLPLSIGITVLGGAGADQVYGSTESDRLFGHSEGPVVSWPHPWADDAPDTLCGGNGDDELVADTMSLLECVDGGNGTGDWCWHADNLPGCLPHLCDPYGGIATHTDCEIAHISGGPATSPSIPGPTRGACDCPTWQNPVFFDVGTVYYEFSPSWTALSTTGGIWEFWNR